MNFIERVNAKVLLTEGSHSEPHFHTEAQPQGAAAANIVADPYVPFGGDYKRSGPDLILSKDGREHVVENYFSGEKRAALAAPDGARLSGELVTVLTGHVQYAQASGGSEPAEVIGHITKLAGSATAIRNGVSITLKMSDNVNKGDVCQAGSESLLGITFIDGTVFGLSANARMVLNEMVFDPNGSSNSSLLGLVQGAVTFVAGETAKHGDMKIDTPVAVERKLLGGLIYKIAPDDDTSSKKLVALIPSQLTAWGGANRGEVTTNELSGLWPFTSSSRETILNNGSTLCSGWPKNGVIG